MTYVKTLVPDGQSKSIPPSVSSAVACSDTSPDGE